MATKPRAVLHVPQSDDDGDPGPFQNHAVEPYEQTDVDRVQSMLQLASGAGKASVKIYKIENGKSIFCDSYQPSEFEDGDFSMIRNAFGAGMFRVMLYGNHPESGAFGIISRVDVTLAENKTPQAAQSGRGDPAIMEMMTTLARGQQAMLDALMQSRNVPARDPMAEMTQMLTMMTTMRSAMGMDHKPPEKSSISEIMEAVREMRAVAQEITPGDADPSMLSMLPQVLDIIKTSAQGQPPAQPVALPSVQLPAALDRATAPANAPPPSSIPPENPEMVNPLEIIKLRGHLQNLISMAKNGDPTQKGADLIFEKLPDDFIDVLELPNWFEALTAFAPDVAPFQTWFMQARDLALAMFDAPETPATGQPAT